MISNLFGNHRKVSRVIYTAIFDDYDNLKKPKYVEKNCDYYCFTDTDIKKVYPYKIIRVPRILNSAVMSGKIYKILPHMFFPQYTFSIWVDASIEIRKSLFEMYEWNKRKASIYNIVHPERNCIYEECKVCLKYNIGNPKELLKQIKKYESEGCPKKSGLLACTLIARYHNDLELIKFNNEWWKETCKESTRDQLSFQYLRWKLKQNVAVIDINLWDNEYFKVLPHKNH